MLFPSPIKHTDSLAWYLEPMESFGWLVDLLPSGDKLLKKWPSYPWMNASGRHLEKFHVFLEGFWPSGGVTCSFGINPKHHESIWKYHMTWGKRGIGVGPLDFHDVFCFSDFWLQFCPQRKVSICIIARLALWSQISVALVVPWEKGFYSLRC